MPIITPLIPREPEPIPGHSGGRVCSQPPCQGQQWHQNIQADLLLLLANSPKGHIEGRRGPTALSSLLGGAVQVLPASLAPSLPLKTSSVGITANECTSRTKQAKCSRGSWRTMRLCEQPRPERSPGGLTGTSPSQLSCPEDSTEPVHAVACSLHSRATMCTA